jgi:hypothetical protein
LNLAHIIFTPGRQQSKKRKKDSIILYIPIEQVSPGEKKVD